MKKLLLFSFLLLGTITLAHADAQVLPTYVSAAIADHARPAADTKRDPDRKPAELVAFAGIKPGDKVVDLIPGGG
jgi:predicted methyltransferase